jgi:hypothetical protein
MPALPMRCQLTYSATLRISFLQTVKLLEFQISVNSYDTLPSQFAPWQIWESLVSTKETCVTFMYLTVQQAM